MSNSEWCHTEGSTLVSTSGGRGPSSHSSWTRLGGGEPMFLNPCGAAIPATIDAWFPRSRLAEGQSLADICRMWHLVRHSLSSSAVGNFWWAIPWDVNMQFSVMITLIIDGLWSRIAWSRYQLCQSPTGSGAGLSLLFPGLLFYKMKEINTSTM